jgi:hypothetical protein
MTEIKFKLGKKPYVFHKETLKFDNYVKPELAAPPLIYGHQNLISTDGWGMLGNDTVGDCVIADLGHRHMLWTAEGSTMTPFSAANSIADYSAITGYNPDDPNSDQGTEFIDALKYNQKTGMLDAAGVRHVIGPYVSIDQTNKTELQTACSLFSNVDLGINFPDSAMTQFNAGKPWTVVKGASIEGGHGIPIVAYDQTYVYVITWGQLQAMDYNFLKTYADEAWLPFNLEFFKNGLSPEGFDDTTLATDYTDLTGQVIPTPSPSPSPGPSPNPSPGPSPDPSACCKAVAKAQKDVEVLLPLLEKSSGRYIKRAYTSALNIQKDLNS